MSSPSNNQSNAGGASLLGALLGGPVVAFRPQLARALRSPLAALFLCQAAYWQVIKGEGKWWRKLRDAGRNELGEMIPPTSAFRQSWEWELGMSRSEQETSRKLLVSLELLETRLSGVPARLHYRVDLHAVQRFLVDSGLSGPSAQLDEFDQLEGEDDQQDGDYSPVGRQGPSAKQVLTFPSKRETKITAETNLETTTTDKRSGLQALSSSGAYDVLSEVQTNLLLAKEPALTAFFPSLLKILRQEKITDFKMAQDLLDELAGVVEAGLRGQRDRVGSPPAFLRRLVARAKEGTFDRVHCIAVQARRSTSPAVAAPIFPDECSPEKKKRQKALARKTCDEIRGYIKKAATLD